MTMKRCLWVSDDPLYVAYHDHEWGIPQKDPQALFEMLCLEGQQAGLSWITVLKKREAYRRLFYQFSATRMAQMTDEEIEERLQDASIIRHRGKITALVGNARAMLAMESAGESFGEFLWEFVGHQPVIHRYSNYRDAPVTSPQAINMSKALKKRGFKFTGPTICHAFMQATGMIIDHQTDCFCHPDNLIHTP